MTRRSVLCSIALMTMLTIPVFSRAVRSTSSSTELLKAKAGTPHESRVKPGIENLALAIIDEHEQETKRRRLVTGGEECLAVLLLTTPAGWITLGVIGGCCLVVFATSKWTTYLNRETELGKNWPRYSWEELQHIYDNDALNKERGYVLPIIETTVTRGGHGGSWFTNVKHGAQLDMLRTHKVRCFIGKDQRVRVLAYKNRIGGLRAAIGCGRKITVAWCTGSCRMGCEDEIVCKEAEGHCTNDTFDHKTKAKCIAAVDAGDVQELCWEEKESGHAWKHHKGRDHNARCKWIVGNSHTRNFENLEQDVGNKKIPDSIAENSCSIMHEKVRERWNAKPIKYAKFTVWEIENDFKVSRKSPDSSASSDSETSTSETSTSDESMS